MSLRPGQVVRLRVNPRDCVSVLDVLEKAGVNAKDMSFSAVVSMALSSMLEGLRQSGVIPDRDGFEYAEKMSPFLRSSQASKIAIANTIHRQGSEFKINPLMPTERSEAGPSHHGSESIPAMTVEQRRASMLLAELNAKRELAEGNPDVMWQRHDQEEFERLYRIVYQEKWTG